MQISCFRIFLKQGFIIALQLSKIFMYCELRMQQSLEPFSMAKKIHYEEFLSKANEIWSDRFFYPELENFVYRVKLGSPFFPVSLKP